MGLSLKPAETLFSNQSQTSQVTYTRTEVRVSSLTGQQNPQISVAPRARSSHSQNIPKLGFISNYMA